MQRFKEFLMKINKGLLLSLAIGSLALTLFACSTPQNTNTAATAPAATPEATPDTAVITAEVTKIEKDWPRILKERDAATARRIEADDIVLVYPEGQTGGKDQDVKDVEAGNVAVEFWEVSAIDVKIHQPDAEGGHTCLTRGLCNY